MFSTPECEMKQDRQFTYNVILRSNRESFLLWESNKYYIFLRARVCVCVWVRAGGCVRVGARKREHVLA